MKKAYLGLAALAVLGTGSLASCNSAKGIMIWGPSEEQAVIDTIIAEYNEANPENKIEYRFRAIEEGTASGDFEKDPLQKNYPSLIAVVDNALSEMHNTYNCIAPVPTDVAAEIEKTNAEKAVATAKVDDTMYAYPISADNGYFLYYNSDVFTADQAKSMESLLATAKAKGKKVLFDLDNGYYSASVFMSPEVFGTEKGISWHYNDENEVVYDLDWATDKGAQVAKDFSDLIVPYVKDGTLIEGDNTAISTLSASGELQAVVSGTWVFADLTKNWGADKVEGTKLPTFNSTFPDATSPTTCQLASFIGSKLYVVNSRATAEEQADAHKIAQLLTSKEGQLERWAVRAAKPANLEACEDDSYLNSRNAAIEGLEAQEPYGAIQAQVVESFYWTPGENVGRALMQGYFDSATPLTTRAEWKAALEVAIESLVDPSKRVVG